MLNKYVHTFFKIVHLGNGYDSLSGSPPPPPLLRSRKTSQMITSTLCSELALCGPRGQPPACADTPRQAEEWGIFLVEKKRKACPDGGGSGSLEEGHDS